MTYDTETYRKTIGQLSDEELIKRLHLGMFNDDALPVAREEAARRNLSYNSEHSEAVIAKEHAVQSALRSNKYIWLVTTPVAAAGAMILGIVGGLVFLFIGKAVATSIDSRVKSSFGRAVAGFALVAVVLLIAAVVKQALRGGQPA